MNLIEFMFYVFVIVWIFWVIRRFIIIDVNQRIQYDTTIYIQGLIESMDELPRGVTLRIPLDEKGADYKNKIEMIEQLLREQGIKFDTGTDLIENIREWKLDWSLEGATIHKN